MPVVDVAPYEVVVGNVGTVYSGRSKRAAVKIFHEYLQISREGEGRAGGEDVTLFEYGEIIAEHAGGLRPIHENPAAIDYGRFSNPMRVENPKKLRTAAQKARLRKIHQKMSTRRREWVWNWNEGGSNSTFAKSRAEALREARKMEHDGTGFYNKMTVDEASLRAGSPPDAGSYFD